MKPLYTLEVMGLAVAISALLAVPASWAQTSPYWTPVGSQSFNAEVLVAAVIQRHAGISAQQLRASASEALIESASSLDDPRISYSIAPLTAGDDIPSGFGNRVGVRQVIQLSQTLPWPGSLALRTDLAAAQAAVEHYNYQELLLQLSTQARQHWIRLWYLDRALEINASHQQLLANLEQVATTQYANGLGAQENLLQIQTDLAEIRRQEVLFEQERRRVTAAINSLLNQPAQTEIGRPVEAFGLPNLPVTSQLQAWMLDDQPELLRATSQSEVAQTRLALEQKNDYPDIQFNLGYNELMNDSSLRLQTGISINVPLDFGKRRARKSAADLAYRSSLAEIDQARNNLLAELETQLSHQEETSKSLTIFESELLPSARQTFNAALANYEGGSGNFATLIDSQRQLLNLSQDFARLRAEQFVAIAEINRLSGGRLWPTEDIQ